MDKNYLLYIFGATLIVIILWLSFRHLEYMKEIELKMKEIEVKTQKRTAGIW